MHSSFWDAFMHMVSGKMTWSVFYIAIIIALFRQYGYRRLLIILFCIALTVTLCDQFTSGFMKPFFQRLRPSHDPELSNLVHIVNNYRGGKFGFASSHAANTFGVAIFICSLLRTRFVWGFLLFWASLVSYSRIYLGVHFPGDIITGAAVGCLFGKLIFMLYQIIGVKWKWLNEKPVKPERNYFMDIPVLGIVVVSMMLVVAKYVVKGL